MNKEEFFKKLEEIEVDSELAQVFYEQAQKNGWLNETAEFIILETFDLAFKRLGLYQGALGLKVYRTK